MGPLSTEAARPLHRPPPPFDDRGIGLSICIVHFHCAGGFRQNPLTCIHVRLLGPCFKTGRMEHRLLAHRERPSSDSCKAPKESTVGGTRQGHRRIPRDVSTRRKLAGLVPRRVLSRPSEPRVPCGTVTLSDHSPGLRDIPPTGRGNLLQGEDHPSVPGRASGRAPNKPRRHRGHM